VSGASRTGSQNGGIVRELLDGVVKNCLSQTDITYLTRTFVQVPDQILCNLDA